MINLSVQVKNYLKAIADLKKRLGHDETSKILCESLYVFVTGNNDVSEYVGNTTLQAQYSVEQYVSLLVSKLATDIQVQNGDLCGSTESTRTSRLPPCIS